ncbi:hypothetical protein E3N88_11827 [Mikania micrantha]|uniref:Uncharacterized protein n=1 Tax=Mikania micrantha TaxID=192012 RepID=A0A5N6P565_9ASTR|nr:hypothetical protein E3N88_11827 [Mikania micrantha]
MGEEDDSLIQQSQDLDQTSALSYSTFSPFAFSPLHAKSLRDGVWMEKPGSSSSEVINNKENIDSNSVEVPKLGMEPMQMKRRKKGSGYNLRKSFAWDRAFFTDEGCILDPFDLTLITGIDANTCRGGLHTIREEGSSSFFSEARCTDESNDMEASKEAPLEELHDKNHTTKRKSEKTDCSMRNHDSLLNRKVTNKVLTSNRTNRGGSKLGGCSEPLAASSYPFSNSHTLKAAKKESKLPKLPMSKPDPCFYANTKGSMSASHLRHNPISKPTTKVEKNSGLKSSLQNEHCSQSKAKPGSGNLHLPVKELTQKTAKNLTHSSKAASLIRSELVQPVQVDRANSRSELVQDSLQICKVLDESASLAAKHLAQHAAANSTPTFSSQIVQNNSLPEAATRLTSSASCHIQRASKGLMISDVLHRCESQERTAEFARPSGLRLPSPSLRLFDERTASVSGSMQQKKNKQYMGYERKNAELGSPVRPPMNSNDITECCAPSTQLSPSPNYTLNTNIKEVTDSITHQMLVTKSVPSGPAEVAVACKRDEEFKVSHSIEQLTKNEGTCRQLMSEGRVPETIYKSVLYNKEHGLQKEDNSSCSRTMDITFRNSHSLEDETDVMEFKCIGTSCISFQNLNVEQRNDDVHDADAFPSTATTSYTITAAAATTPCVSDPYAEEGNGICINQATSIRGKVQLHDSPLRDTVTQLLNDNSSAGSFHIEPTTNNKKTFQLPVTLLLDDNPLSTEGFNFIPTTSTKNKSLLQDTSAPTVEAQHKISEKNHKNQEIGLIVAEKSQESCGIISETKPAVHVSTDGLKTHCQFQSENEVFEGCGPISNISKTNVEDGQLQLLDGDALVQSCSSLTSEVPHHFTENSDHGGILGKHAEFSNTGIKLEQVSQSNECLHQQQESVCKVVWNVVEGSDNYECDARTSNSTIVDITPPIVEVVGKSDRQLCVYGTVGSTVIDSPEFYEKHNDWQPTECTDLTLNFVSELEPSVKDKMFRKSSTCMEYCSAGKKPCSFQTDSMLEEKTTLFLDDQVLMNNRLLSTEKISDRVVDPELNTNASAQNLNTVQANEDDQPQGFVGIMSLVETYDDFKNEQSNLSLSVSQQLTTGMKTTSTPESCCLIGGGDESLLTKTTCLIGHEGSEMSIGVQVDATPIVGDIQLESDNLKDRKDATMLMKRSNSIKRQDNSLVIHPPNAVPFSDEWLAAFEAAGEEILTMKCGAVQHSPQDKSLPEPSPWSPVKRKANQIGPYDCTKYINVMPSNSQLSDQ